MSRPSFATLLISAAGALITTALIAAGNPRDALSLAAQEAGAAAFFAESITIDELRRAYRGTTVVDPVTLAPRTDANATGKRNIKVLIVPGHEPDAGGTAFGDVYERDVVADMADALARRLGENPRYEIKVARTKYAWDPELAAYFARSEAAILAFRAFQALLMAEHIANGSVALAEDPIDHLSTPTAGAIKLYGINKWTAEEGYDIVLHLHVNDYPRPRGRAGTHAGFAVYVPDAQYSNANASRAIGEAIAYRLAAYHPASSLPKEGSVVPDQQLIALGSNNSAESAAVLVEYGYIYEPQFQDDDVRPLAVEDYAYATYLGLQDFFKDPASSSGSVAVPYDWSAREGGGAEAYALQATLRHLGYYPPRGKTLYDCPISGTIGPCTKAAMRVYERDQGLAETGTLTDALRASLMRANSDPFAARRIP